MVSFWQYKFNQKGDKKMKITKNILTVLVCLALISPQHAYAFTDTYSSCTNDDDSARNRHLTRKTQNLTRVLSAALMISGLILTESTSKLTAFAGWTFFGVSIFSFITILAYPSEAGAAENDIFPKQIAQFTAGKPIPEELDNLEGKGLLGQYKTVSEKCNYPSISDEQRLEYSKSERLDRGITAKLRNSIEEYKSNGCHSYFYVVEDPREANTILRNNLVGDEYSDWLKDHTDDWIRYNKTYKNTVLLVPVKNSDIQPELLEI